MSDAVALAAVIVSGTIGIGSLGLSFWNSKADRGIRLAEQRLEHEEKYRIQLYDKRLEAHQQAYEWLMKLITPMRLGAKVARQGLEIPHRSRLWELYRDARAWWDATCLYLDDASRGQVIDVIELAGGLLNGTIPEGADLEKAYRDALRSVQEGIGMKHLDTPDRKDESAT